MVRNPPHLNSRSTNLVRRSKAQAAAPEAPTINASVTDATIARKANVSLNAIHAEITGPGIRSTEVILTSVDGPNRRCIDRVEHQVLVRDLHVATRNIRNPIIRTRYPDPVAKTDSHEMIAMIGKDPRWYTSDKLKTCIINCFLLICRTVKSKRYDRDDRNMDYRNDGRDYMGGNRGGGRNREYYYKPSHRGRGGFRASTGVSKRMDGYGPPPSKSPFSNSGSYGDERRHKSKDIDSHGHEQSSDKKDSSHFGKSRSISKYLL